MLYHTVILHITHDTILARYACICPIQMLIRGLGWPAAETQRPGPPGQGDPPDAGGVMAGPGLRSAEEELKAQLLALQVVSQARLCLGLLC